MGTVEEKQKTAQPEKACQHKWVLKKSPEPPNSGWYEHECELCHETWEYDTSD